MPEKELHDDHLLFAAIARGDEGAFTTLFHKYRLKIYTFVLKEVRSAALAEELTHDILLSLWTQQARLGEIEDPQAYLFTIVYNKIYSCLRQQAKEYLRLRQLPQPAPINSTEETILAGESRRLIEEAIRDLPPQRQKIYRLSREQGKSYDDIAAEMQLSRHTVKNQLIAALKNIRQHLHRSFFSFFII